MHRIWRVRRTNREFLSYISKAASVSPVTAQVLVNRGLKDIDSIRKFLHPSLSDLNDPYLLPDMEAAVERIVHAHGRNEKILVHGDYDADGLTATAVILELLEKAGICAGYHIPDRLSEGYGLSEVGIRKAVDMGASLIITVDCGVSSFKQIENARGAGIDVIVTDHHEPPERLPDALAVIDPHREDSEYPFRSLAGVGVAFKLAQALAHRLSLPGRDEFMSRLLDLVAIGTVADSVPLNGENRILVTFGLKAINDPSCRTGIRALREVSGYEGEVRAGTLSFTLIPRINAAGRLGTAGTVVELLRTEDILEARKAARFLDDQNKMRQKIEGEVLDSATEMIDGEDPGEVIVLHSADWHPGVIGIVASRLVDIYFRPVFLFSVKDKEAKGSARGIPGLHLYEAIAECSDLLAGFGGHRQAAGLRIDVEKIGEFSSRIREIVSRRLGDEDLTPSLEIDAAVQLSQISFGLVREIESLEPFGEANMAPVLGARNIRVLNHSIVGANHLKMRLVQERTHLDTIGFNMGEKMAEIGNAGAVDIAFVPAINEWNGSRTIQLNLKALRPAGEAGGKR
jgi:single-stranded-DNA-specific exonuclease